jgi:alanine dehydrogenase
VTVSAELRSGSIRYLSRADVKALLPPYAQRVRFAEDAYRLLAAGRVELPPKPAVHPRHDAFIHAMPTYVRDLDVAALKWIAGYPQNRRRGLPYISGLLIVNDGATGEVIGILDAREITAVRTAAATGAVIKHFAPEGWRSVALIGCGEQGRYHARMVEALYPRASLAAYDRHRDRIAGAGASARVASSVTDAAEGADVLITAIPLTRTASPVLTAATTAGRRLTVAIDFDASIGVDVVEQADLFLVDDRAQFDHYRGLGHFAGWPDPDGTIGESIGSPTEAKNIVCCPLGVAVLDAVFAANVLERAAEIQEGQQLPV